MNTKKIYVLTKKGKLFAKLLRYNVPFTIARLISNVIYKGKK